MPGPSAAVEKDGSAPALDFDLSARAQQPSVLKDFHVLINLVDLCK